MPTVKTYEANIYYEVHGTGPAVVLAHGAGGNTLIWWQQVPHFSREYTVITFDHRGFGRSTCTPAAFHPRHFADDLRAVLDAAEVGDAALVCQSMGGWTGMQTALTSPDRVRCLVLCGTPGGVLTEKILQGLAGAARELRNQDAGTFDPCTVLAPTFPTREPERTFLYGQISGLNPLLDPANLGKLIEGALTADDLKAYQTPTLLLVCEHDAIFPADGMREVAATIPGASVYEFDGVGHSSYWEQPERFNRVVGEFISRYATVSRNG